MDYDRGEKLQHYRQVPSLETIVFVWHTERRIEVWSRDGAGAWTVSDVASGELAPLPGVSCTLVVDDVYRDALGPAV